MNTIDDLFQYLATLRKVNSTPFSPSYDHLKLMKTYMDTLSLIDPQLWDISIMSIKDKRLGDVVKTIKKENSKYIEYYSKNEEYLQEQTDWRKIYSLVQQEVDRRFNYEQSEAIKEWNKYNDAFRTCNHATRLYNSMDCRPGQEEEDLRIIRQYLDELYDIVGYPVHVEKVNDEHELYREKRREAERKLEEIKSKKSDYHSELEKGIDADVYDLIYRIVSDVAREIENCERGIEPQQKQERNRPRKTKPKYANLQECIRDKNALDSLEKAAKGYMGNFNEKIDTQFCYFVFKLLKDRKKIDCAQDHFAQLLINHIGEDKVTFKPHSASSGRHCNDPKRKEWLSYFFNK